MDNDTKKAIIKKVDDVLAEANNIISAKIEIEWKNCQMPFVKYEITEEVIPNLWPDIGTEQKEGESE